MGGVGGVRGAIHGMAVEEAGVPLAWRWLTLMWHKVQGAAHRYRSIRQACSATRRRSTRPTAWRI
jgi:hypothetical protein